MSAWIKICGITRAEDALGAAEAGANAIGFVFFRRSPRYVSPAAARAIASVLPARVERAGVFVDARREEILGIVEDAGLTWVQLHGQESIDFAQSLGVPWVKALRLRGAEEIRLAAEFAEVSHEGRVILDSHRRGTPGGTGERFDWALTDLLHPSRFIGRLIVAGGLAPDNVGEAIRLIRPWGVDVSSGVESAPGLKDREKIEAFVEGARAAGPPRARGVGA